MTGINHVREQFEAAFIEKCATDLNRKVPGITREAAIKFITCNWLARSGDDYELPVPNGAWWAWQASRTAVVVELPAERRIRHMPTPDENSSYNEALENCRDAIEAQGVKCK